MKRHKDFKSITGNVKVQNALRDLYDHPDKVELYPGIFCEGSADMNLDPGPNEKTFALWAAIFSDAITLVRSDRFYTVVSDQAAPFKRTLFELTVKGLEHEFSHLLGNEGGNTTK